MTHGKKRSFLEPVGLDLETHLYSIFSFTESLRLLFPSNAQERK